MIHGGAPEGWLEFSVDLHPLGTPAPVAAAIASATYQTYAALATVETEAHLARDAGVEPASVLVTAGATEGIRLVASAFARIRPAVVIGPTYSEYERSCARAGAEVHEVRAQAPRFDPPLADATCALESGAVVFLCDPNNPTGRALDPADLRALASNVRAGSILVIDRSFAPFAGQSEHAADLIEHGSTILIRSLTKRLAAPGIRIGYVLAAPDLIATLRQAQDPWSVSAHALAAARAAAWDLTEGERRIVAGWRDGLTAALTELGFGVVPSTANFVLADGGAHAATAIRELAARRIAVRDCTSFGLAGYLRFAVRAPEDQDALVAALSAVIPGQPHGASG